MNWPEGQFRSETQGTLLVGAVRSQNGRSAGPENPAQPA